MSTANKLPTQEKIKTLYWYDKETGVFRARFGYNGHKPWRTVGRTETKGYLQIAVDKKLYMAHRLAWIYVTGEDPSGYQIDHIDMNKSNNAFSNLRLVSNKQNCENRKFNSRNKTGCRGVYEQGGRFVAEICHNYKRIKIGRFDTLEQAAAAAEAKRAELFSHA